MTLLTVLLSVTAYSAVVYGAILLFRLIFKKHVSPSMMYIVWFLLIARLIIPVTLDSGFSLITIPKAQAALGPQVSQAVSSNDTVSTAQVSYNPSGSKDINSYTGDTAPDNAPLQEHLSAGYTEEMQRSFALDLPTVLIGIWILGMVLMFIQTLISAVLLRRRIKRDSLPIPDEWFEIAEKINRELGLRGSIKIVMIKNFISPALIASLYPTIVMPAHMSAQSAQKVEFALRHEMTHLKRRDHIICLLLAALRIIYWFNPVVWLAANQLKADMETACDSTAVKPMSREETKRYAVTVLEMYADDNARLVLGMSLGSTKKTAERRIRGIFMRKHSSHKVKIAAAVLAAVLAFACFTTACQPVQETAPPSVVENTQPTATVSGTPTVTENSPPPIQPTATVSPTEALTPTPTLTPEETPTPTTTVSATAKPKTFPDEDYGNKINKDTWLYYIDLKNPVNTPESEYPLYYIHRVKKDGSGDESLNVLCFRFDFAGEYLYADTNINYGDFGHWITYRYDLDGGGKTKIEYKDMRDRFSKGDTLYFSLFDDPAFYSATTACADVQKYEVKVPDDDAIRKKLGYNYEVVFVKVTNVKNGWVYFEFKVTDTGPMPHYTGNYRMNLSSSEIEKTDDGIYEAL